MFRVILAVVFFVASSILIAASTLPSLDSSVREILGNVGTEIFGILVTIALVDWVLEKRRRQDRARELAWSVLHSIEHAVWVWQGGPRQIGTNELLGIVSGIKKQDQLEPFTEGLFLMVGLQCRSILQMEAPAVKSLAGLSGALDDLVSLATIRDLPNSTRIRTVSEILEASVTGLARLLGQATERMPSGLIWYLDSTEDGQTERYRQAAPIPGTSGGPFGLGAFGGPGGYPALEPNPPEQ
jgi:hypothetical protein